MNILCSQVDVQRLERELREDHQHDSAALHAAHTPRQRLRIIHRHALQEGMRSLSFFSLIYLSLSLSPSL